MSDYEEELEKQKAIEQSVEIQRRSSISKKTKPKDMLENNLEFFDKFIEPEIKTIERDSLENTRDSIPEFQHFTRDIKITNFNDVDILMMDLYNDTIDHLRTDFMHFTANSLVSNLNSHAHTTASRDGFMAKNLLQDIRKTDVQLHKEDKKITQW